MRDRKKLLSIILVFVMVLQMAFPTYADTRTVRRTLTKTTTTYTTQKIKLKKKASKTYSVVGKTVTYVSYRTKDSNPVKTTKKITPTLKYKKNSRYCTKKDKTVITEQTTITIKQTTGKTNQTTIVKPNKDTSTEKKEIPISNVVRSKVGYSVSNAFDTLGFKVYVDPSVHYSGYYSTKDRSITLRKNDDTLYHELGHFVSFISGCSCSSAEFKAIYGREKTKYTKYNKAYVCKDSNEFFAECYYLYLTDSSWLKRNLPKTYQFIQKSLQKITPDRIERILKTYSPIWK